MHTRLHSFDFLALIGLAAITLVPKDEVTFGIADGSQQTKTFELRSALTTEESALSFGDNEMSPGVGMVRERNQTAKVHDEYLAVADGRPAKLRRRFEELTETLDVDAPEQEDGIRIRHGDESKTSPLVGHSVVFGWSPEEDRYSASFAEDDDGEEAWLAGLHEDMDFRRFLPGRPVAEGDRWTLPAGAIADILAPGGQLFVEERDQESEHDHGGGGLRVAMVDVTSIRAYDELGGDVVVRYAGATTRSGRKIALLEITAEVDGTQEVADELLAENARVGMDSVEYSVAVLERSYDGKGTLAWDLERGCMHAFDFEADVTLECEAEWVADAMGMEIELSSYQLLRGTIVLNVSTE